MKDKKGRPVRVFTTKNGKKSMSLSASQKGDFYAAELRSKHRFNVETMKHDGPILTKSQKNYRYGYLQARQDVSDSRGYVAAKKNGTLTEYREKLRLRQEKRNQYKRQQTKAVSKKSKAVKKDSDKKSEAVYDYSKQFDYDKRGWIKGSYTADGFFEPD